MARAQIGQLFEQKLSTADVHYMTDYLFSVEHWSRYELVLFMSTTSALSLAVVDQLAREVSHRSKQYQALNLDLVTNLLFNTEMTFIEARLPTKAKFFAAALKALTPGDDHMGAHFLITFGRISYQYCFEDRYQATLQIKKLLQALKILHMNDYYQFFDRSFKEFQQQYC